MNDNEIGSGLSTMIVFENPVLVKYETANLVPFENISNKKVKSLGIKNFDTIMSAEFFEVEVDAHVLLVQTMYILHHKTPLFYESDVNRIEHYRGEHFLKINPQ